MNIELLLHKCQKRYCYCRVNARVSRDKWGRKKKGRRPNKKNVNPDQFLKHLFI